MSALAPAFISLIDRQRDPPQQLLRFRRPEIHGIDELQDMIDKENSNDLPSFHGLRLHGLHRPCGHSHSERSNFFKSRAFQHIGETASKGYQRSLVKIE